MQGQWQGHWGGDWLGGSGGGSPVVFAALVVGGTSVAVLSPSTTGAPALRAGVEFVSIPTWRDRLRKSNNTARVRIPRKARRKAKAIEAKAAALALAPTAPEWKFEALATKWAALVHAPDATAESLFMARVRLQIQRIREDDDEEALLLA